MPATEQIASANFEFLLPYDATLRSLGLMAERYMSSDSPSAALKLRVFAERIVCEISNELGIDAGSLAERAGHSLFREGVPCEVQQGIELLRRHGNQAAHNHAPIPPKYRIPLLRAAFDLGRWFVSVRHQDSSMARLEFRDVEQFLAERSATNSAGVQRSGASEGPFLCPIPGCRHQFASGRLGWDAHIASPNRHADWQPEIDDPNRRKDVFRQAFPEFFAGRRSRRRPSLGREGSTAGGKACPIPGCHKVFLTGRGGWDAHVASSRNHPDWHPEVADPDARKKRFRAEFMDWFR